jgi:sarcosine oxidase subunit gamma
MTVFWLSPDRWVLVSERTAVNVLLNDMQDGLVDCHHSLADCSDAMNRITVRGPDTVQLLQRCGTLDFASVSFKRGKVMRATFADTTAIYHRKNEEQPCFDLYVPRSFSSYAVQLLHHLVGHIQ